jgi:chromosome segregation ATPase
MQNTLYQEKSGNFLAKNAELRVEAQTESKKSQKIAELKLNLIEFLTQPVNNKVFFLTGCADKKARIVLSVKAMPLGEQLTETLSDASGSEQFSEEGSEHDQSSEKIIKKPPVFRPLAETSPEEKQRIVNLTAKVSLLEKENQQIRSEKDDVKLQLTLAVENSLKEREKFCEHSLKLDGDIEELKHKNKRLDRKVNKYREKYKKTSNDLQETLEENEVLKSKFPESEKVKLLDLIKTLKKEVFDLKQEMLQLKSVTEIHESEREMTENAKDQLQSLNLKYLAEISSLKVKILEFQENFVMGASEVSGNKKKVESVLSEIKKELEKVQIDRDEVFGKNTDLLIENQKLKNKQIENTEKLNQKIRQLEFELQEKTSESQEISERLNEEITKNKTFERKTLTEKQEVHDQITKINKNYYQAIENNDVLAKTLRDNERKLARNRSETETNSYEKLQKAIQVHLSEISKLRQQVASADVENQDLRRKNNDLQVELSKIQEISPDGSSELAVLSQKLESSSKIFLKEKSELEDKVSLLKQENLLLEEQIKDLQKSYESEIMALKVRAISLEESSKVPKTTAEFVSSLEEENYKQALEMNKIEIKELKGLAMKLQDELKDSERKYMDLKVSLANFDLEKESVNFKYREIQDQIAEYSNNYTTMEIEFFRANEKLAKVLNENNDLINEVEFLKMQIFNLQRRRRKK